MARQLDFIFFVYGLCFFLLSTTLLGRRRDTVPGLPWHWLLWFGLLHGTDQWLNLLAMSLGAPPGFAAVRLGVMAASFLPLLEFARAANEARGTPVPGRWCLLIPMVLAALGGPWGVAGLNVTCRYAIALPASLFTGMALLREQALHKGRQRRRLCLAGIGFLLYGLASGLVGPRRPSCRRRGSTRIRFWPSTAFRSNCRECCVPSP